ncbi:MAG: hypothetical protein HUU08_13670 [Candidatus Brocadia sp.]|nr:hypothetical protein [Candidatus Brocadia sp.]
MRYVTVLFVVAIALTSSTTLQKSKTLNQAKAGLDCIEYTEGMDWKQISEKLGAPSITPLPEPGTNLSRNARGYEDMTIIFHTERKEFKEGERVRFHEVVTKIEVCKEK